MTTQRAIEIISPDNTMIDYTEQELRDACIMAIKALQRQIATIGLQPPTDTKPDYADLHDKFIGRKRVVSMEDNTEKVNHPSHYQGNKFEVIDIIDDYNLDFCKGNAIKYILRAGKKIKDKEIEDLQKSIWYLQHKIKLLEENQ